ncbi:MAG: RNA polymerase sigma factor [Terriglobales bacterium]
MAVRRPARGSRKETHDLPGEERLLVEAAKKDPSRFAELYELNFTRVYAFIARRVGDRDVAQDLTSDVFHKALASIQSFEWRGVPFAGWLLRIAANMIVDRSKRSGREVSGQDDVPDPGTQPNLEEIDQHARLFRLVDQLPPDQSRVIGMRFAEEKSIREIANELGRSEGAVKQLQFRALQNLRQRMEGANA